ncbi:hypothetical protein GCM10010466_09100 [Planomonospora alba]|uniref:Helix-turn-helix domain-containing protein n=1 Tax=Planomonospora alba TaxID=161354 RepID=A0ABP6MND2_9ACTN
MTGRTPSGQRSSRRQGRTPSGPAATAYDIEKGEHVPVSGDRLWGVEEVSDFLGVPVSTLYVWRHRRIGPQGRKIGRHLRYRPQDVRAWVEEQE